MGPLSRVLSASLMLAAPVCAHAVQVDTWSSEIAEASERFGIPQDWIRRVMQAESAGRTRLNGRPIESPAGAMGLMQLMPETWREMRDAHGLGPDPHLPRDNILAGAAYLRAMYDRFGYPGLFAAYNAGPGRYEAYLAGARLPAETRAYVAAVAGRRPQATVRSGLKDGRAAPPPLFAFRATEATIAARPAEPDGDQRAPAGAPASSASALFVPLGAAPRR